MSIYLGASETSIFEYTQASKIATRFASETWKKRRPAGCKTGASWPGIREA
jgi:hypothetical protein